MRAAAITPLPRPTSSFLQRVTLMSDCSRGLRIYFCMHQQIAYTVRIRKGIWLLRMTKGDEPLTSGDRKSRLTRAAPVSCPISVILFGSPPKEPMFFLTQRTPASMSLMPKFASSESVLSKAVFVLRKPETKGTLLVFCWDYEVH